MFGGRARRRRLDSVEVTRRLNQLNAPYRAAGFGRDGRSHDFDFDQPAPAPAVPVGVSG
ncbi:hypothetical protein [Micromonospora globbae]|uniref:hypothetical protein n=1 Tax=Micromonospora globbae TaxID=1894969 RepID=UPI00341591C3